MYENPEILPPSKDTRIDDIIRFEQFLDEFDVIYTHVFEPRGFGKNTALQCYTAIIVSELGPIEDDEDD